MLNALLYSPIATKLTRVVGHDGWVLDMEFQEDPLNGRRDTAEKVLCSSCKVPFILERSRPNLHVLYAMEAEWQIWSFRNTPSMKEEVHPIRYFTIQLSTLHYRPIMTKLTCIVGDGGWCSIYMVPVPHMEFQENHLNRRRVTCKKLHCTWSKVPFIMDQ